MDSVYYDGNFGVWHSVPGMAYPAGGFTFLVGSYIDDCGGTSKDVLFSERTAFF